MGEKGATTEKYHASAPWKLRCTSLSNSEGTFVTLLCVFGVLSPTIKANLSVCSLALAPSPAPLLSKRRSFVCMFASIIRRTQVRMTHAGHEKQRFPLQRHESFLRNRDNIS